MGKGGGEGEGCAPYVAEGSLLEFYQQWAGSLSRVDPAVGRFFVSGGHHKLECMFQRARGDTMHSSAGSGGGPRIMILGSKTGVQQFRVGFGPV